MLTVNIQIIKRQKKLKTFLNEKKQKRNCPSIPRGFQTKSEINLIPKLRASKLKKIYLMTCIKVFTKSIPQKVICCC